MGLRSQRGDLAHLPDQPPRGTAHNGEERRIEQHEPGRNAPPDRPAHTIQPRGQRAEVALRLVGPDHAAAPADWDVNNQQRAVPHKVPDTREPPDNLLWIDRIDDLLMGIPDSNPHEVRIQLHQLIGQTSPPCPLRGSAGDPER